MTCTGSFLNKCGPKYELRSHSWKSQLSSSATKPRPPTRRLRFGSASVLVQPNPDLLLVVSASWIRASWSAWQLSQFHQSFMRTLLCCGLNCQLESPLNCPSLWMCVFFPVMGDCHPIKDVFPTHLKFSWDRIRIYLDPDQEKVITGDKWMHEWISNVIFAVHTIMTNDQVQATFACEWRFQYCKHKQVFRQQYLALHIKHGSGNVGKIYQFILVISEMRVCLEKNVLQKCLLCAGSPITPNYAENTTSNVSPWCTCSASGSQRQQCTQFLDYFTNNICLSKSPVHSSDYYTHWSLICLYYNRHWCHMCPVSSSAYCCN